MKTNFLNYSYVHQSYVKKFPFYLQENPLHTLYNAQVKVEVKAKLFRSLTKHRAMKTYCGIGGIAPQIL
jgi:hypothetical protein